MLALPEELARRCLERRREALLARPPAQAELDELQNIEVALTRLASGRWGLCELCGHAIGHQLLRAHPERRRCLSCEHG